MTDKQESETSLPLKDYDTTNLVYTYDYDTPNLVYTYPCDGSVPFNNFPTGMHFRSKTEAIEKLCLKVFNATPVYGTDIEDFKAETSKESSAVEERNEALDIAEKHENRYREIKKQLADDKAHLALIKQERDEAIEQVKELKDQNHSLMFRLSQERTMNRDHEDDYLCVWKLIKEPNETVVQACKRIVRERDEAQEMQSKALRERESTEREVDLMLERALKAEAERDHWKANHDNQVSLKAAIASRPDLKDRSEKVQSLERALREAWLLMDDVEGNESIDEWKNKYSKYMPSYRCPECDALASHGANDGPCEQHESQ